MNEYKTMEQALEQLSKCKFEDEIGHPLENNTAFIFLNELSSDLNLYIKYPIGKIVEVEITGKIAGVLAIVKKDVRVKSITYTLKQHSGAKPATKYYQIDFADANKPIKNETHRADKDVIIHMIYEEA